MKKFEKVRGMHNVPIKDSDLWNHLCRYSESLLKSFSFSEIRLPIIEYTELFKRSVGDGTDIVNKEMFTFISKSDKSLTLRPEGTAGCMRAAIDQNLLDTGPQRLFYSGPMYRYERPQKGRAREFFQLSAEIYGIESVYAEIELFQIINKIIKKYNVSDSRLEINSLGSEDDQKKFSEALLDYLIPLKDQLDEDSLKRLEKNPLRILDSKLTQTKDILKSAPKIEEFRSKDSVAKFGLLKNLLNDLEINFEENENLVRGLDYYNDSVFEWKSDSLGSQNTFCAGGRYDSLAKKLGGRQTSAVGVSLGMDRLILAIEENFEMPESKKISIIILDQKYFKEGIQLSDDLRSLFPQYKVRFSGFDTNLKSQLKRAGKDNFNFAIIIGREEVESKSYTIKNLDSGMNTEKISFAELTEILNEKHE